jgi:CubicO group peptidase (beta-lactamase class C family)
MEGQTMKKCWVCILLTGLVLAGCGPKRGAVREASPEEAGMDSTRLGRLDAVVNTAISRGDFPGAVLLVGRRGRVVFRKAYGYRQWIPRRRRMTVDTIFDTASMTKPVATAASIMLLLEQGRLRLWDEVTDFIPDFKPFVKAGEGEEEEEEEIGGTRIWHLLTHTSGLPPYTEAEGVKELYGDLCSTEDLVSHIAGLDKISPPGEEFHYSCLGYITLAYIIQRITGYTVADFASIHIFRPLGMRDTGYLPGDDLIHRCAPTELQEGLPLVGRVHDPLAGLQGGISGNAGLFSTADDLYRFACMLLNGGELEGTRIFSPLAVRRMTEIYARTAFAGRGLGWDLDSDYSTNGGDLFGPESYGHTGYTGTSIWVDPETETVVIFLTNRVHPVDEGAVISTRSRVANVVAASILEP